MEQHKLEITLEQRDWERLQKLSERNGENMESLVAKMVARELARTFNKPPDVVISSEARRIRDSFIAGRTQTTIAHKAEAQVPTPEEVGGISVYGEQTL